MNHASAATLTDNPRDGAATDSLSLAHAPTPGGLPLLGNLLALRRDPLETLRSAQRECGDVVRLRLGLHHVLLLVRPEHLERVLLDLRYEKRFRVYRKMQIVLGEGLVTSNGELWKRQRRLAQPAFHRRRIADLGVEVVGCAEALAERWSKGAGGVVDVLADTMGLSLEVVSRTLFGTSSDAERSAKIADALGESSRQLSRRMLAIVDLPLWVPTPANRRLAAAIRTLDGAVRSFIEERRRSGEERDDLLGMLLAARDGDSGTGMDDVQLRDELVTLFAAGQETTALALAWTFWLLSQEPDAERELHEELALVLGGRAPAIADLPQLPYTLQVLKEAIRLYPPLWLLNRTAREDDEIAGYRIRAGSHVFFSPFLTHRHPELWPEPDRFRPGRFASPQFADLPRFAYLPFSGGPRQCIGHDLALVQAQLVLATLAQRFRLAALPGQQVVPEAAVTLRPGRELPMRLSRR